MAGAILAVSHPALATGDSCRLIFGDSLAVRLEKSAESNDHERMAVRLDWSPRSNPFFSEVSFQFSLKARQRAALEALSRSTDERLAKLAGEKLTYFNDVEASDVKNFVSRTPEAQQSHAAAECALTTFSSAEFDRDFRRLVISFLGESKLSDSNTLEILMPLSRGIHLSGGESHPISREVVLANNAIMRITERLGRTYISERQAGNYGNSTVIKQWVSWLAEADAIKVNSLGGGVNDSKKVTFRHRGDGSERVMVYKSLAGSLPVRDGYFDANPIDFRRFIFHAREVRSHDFYEFILSRYRENGGRATIDVPTTLEGALVVNGEAYGVGSFQEFQKGFVDLNEFQSKDWQAWEVLRSTPEWREAEAVLRTIDFIYGNSDRLRKRENENIDKNLMIDVTVTRNENGQVSARLNGIRLIDNGIGLPGHSDYTIDLAPVRDHVPPALRAALASRNENDFKELTKDQSNFIYPAGIQDYIRRFVEAQNRMRP